jgi:hypothetical protein
MVALFKQTKAITPNQTTIMYWNTELDFSMYSAHAKMEYMEAKGTPVYLRDETGTVISLCNDGNVYCNITIFDLSQPAARQIWLEAITNMTATGWVDGIYADHSCEKGVGIGTDYPTKNNGPNQLCNGNGAKRQCYNFTTAAADSWNSWHCWATNYSQEMLSHTTGGPVIAGPLTNIVNDCTFDGIRAAQKNLTMIEAKCKGGGGCSPSKNELVQYLAAADKYTYLHCMLSVDEAKPGGDFVAQTTWPEMDYKLGAPNSSAYEVPSKGSRVWRREFASGAWVEWNNNPGKLQGEYYFPGHSPPSPPPSPTPPSPSPPAPPVQPTGTCPVVKAACSYREADHGRDKSATWAECCAVCNADSSCVHWVWSPKNAPHYCHLHGAKATLSTNPESVCGSKQPASETKMP